MNDVRPRNRNRLTATAARNANSSATTHRQQRDGEAGDHRVAEALALEDAVVVVERAVEGQPGLLVAADPVARQERPADHPVDREHADQQDDEAERVGREARRAGRAAGHQSSSWRNMIRTYGAVSTTVSASMNIAAAAAVPKSPPLMPSE